MKKKLDKKTLVIKQAAFFGIAVEAVVCFKVLSHYTVVVWNILLGFPTTVGNAFTSICEQIAHIFGA